MQQQSKICLTKLNRIELFTMPKQSNDMNFWLSLSITSETSITKDWYYLGIMCAPRKFDSQCGSLEVVGSLRTGAYEDDAENGHWKRLRQF